MPKPARPPEDEELLAIAKEALAMPIDAYHLANVEISAQNIVEQTGEGGEKWNLALVKMMLLCSFRVRQMKGLIQ